MMCSGPKRRLLGAPLLITPPCGPTNDASVLHDALLSCFIPENRAYVNYAIFDGYLVES